MKKSIMALAAATTLMTHASEASQNTAMQPGAVFEGAFATTHNTPPFSKITNADYEPAIKSGIARANAEIDAITANPAAPTFENTIVALERVGQDLDRVNNVFFNLLEADSDAEMMDISMRMTPVLSDYGTSIVLNEKLWERVKTVYNNRASLTLSPEQQTLLQKTYDSFALSGADLTGADRDTFRRLSSELSELTTRFGQNVLKELNTYEIWLGKDDIAGLPEGVVAEAAELAAGKGRSGEYLFTLAQPTYLALMKYSQRPDIREKVYKLYTSRNTKGEYSNLSVMQRIATLRLQIANLLGAANYAEHSLKRTMARTPENVYKLLDQLRDAYRPAVEKEMAELTAYASQFEGHPVEIKPWDYSYYANLLKNARYSYDEESLRPYFELDNVIKGVFGLATRLYGLQFTPNTAIEPYHPDVRAFDVTEADGRFVGVIYTDFFPRESKRPGAWMTEFRSQHHDADGKDVRPLVSIVMNFTKPTADRPSLLTPYEVETFLHEFGHALHGLLSQCNYTSTAGTNVYRDFVELPSQFNENYLTEPEFLKTFATHYQTGEPIPAEMIEKIVKSSQFGAAYACMRQLAFGYNDMAWHTITDSTAVADPAAFERAATEQVAVFEPVEGSLTSPQFSHIFAGGYAAGYYSYKWAEVLDADAFDKFKADGIFNAETAASFRGNVLERGGSEAPDELYRRFRGQDPTIDALLRRDGILPPLDKQPLQKKD